jgi:hypothetical protein
MLWSPEEILINFKASMIILFNLFGNMIDTVLSVNIATDIPVANTAITTTAVSLATLFFAMQFISEVSAFRMDRIEEAIRLAMKVVIAKIILENSGAISDMIFGLFWGTSVSTLGSEIKNLGFEFTDVINPVAEPGIFEINNILAIMLIGMPILALTLITMCSIVITVAGIFFEVLIHQQIAPIALSTLVNDTTRGTGISFIKSYSAVCLQVGVIGLCVSVYSILSTKLGTVIDSFMTSLGAAQLIGPIVTAILPLIMFLCLTTAIKRSGDIVKRMLGA